MSFIEQEDPAVANLIDKERNRQESTLNLIAAENTAPAAILEARRRREREVKLGH